MRITPIQVPARICFFGDHQDYLDLPVIAGTIDRFITFTAVEKPGLTLQIILPDISESIEISLEDNGEHIKKKRLFPIGLGRIKTIWY